MDKLENVFELRKQYMMALTEKCGYYELPLQQDLSKPSVQRKIREMSHNCNEEIFEALAELKRYGALAAIEATWLQDTTGVPLIK